MKLLLFMPSFRGGGAEKVFVNLANYLSKFHDVTIAVCQELGPNKKLLCDRVKIVSYNKKNIFKSFFKHKNLILEIGPDMVFSNTVSCNAISFLVGFYLKKVYRVTTLFIGREANIVNAKDFKSKLRDILAYRTYALADGLVFNSLNTKESVLKVQCRLNLIKSKVISNPVLDKKIDENCNLSLNKSRLIKIISVGRLSIQKNHNLSIEVVKNLVEKGFDVELDIYGVGSLEDELLSKIIDCRLENQVRLKGYVEDVSSLYKEYDLFLIASLWEGFGNVIVEALAAGLPIVATNSKGGVPELLCDKDYGEVCEFNEEDLACAIVGEFKGNSRIKAIKRIKKANEFTLDVIGEKYRDFLENV